MSEIKNPLVEVLQDCYKVPDDNIELLLYECLKRCVENNFYDPELKPTWKNVNGHCTWEDISSVFGLLIHK
jgi:hypothetical protein